jgi:protein-tyrosine phosphatase
MSQDRLSRHLAWDGCLNVRDLGGLPTLDGGETRWQSVIRADTLGRLSGAGQQSMHDYGVRTVIDLRSPQELAIDSYQLAAAYGCLRLHLPVEKYYPHVSARIAQATSLAEVYCLIADHYADAIAAILEAVGSAPPGGVVLHCYNGKDRTGMMAALLLGIAGVPAGEIANDYAASQARLWPQYEKSLPKGASEGGESFWSKPWAEPATMVGFLGHLDERYGGVRAYLAQAGMQTEQIAQIDGRLRMSLRR